MKRVAAIVFSIVCLVLGLVGKGVVLDDSGPKQAPVPQVVVDGLADHQGARSEAPAGVSAAQLDAGREQQEALAASDQLPAVTPDAAPSQRGCKTVLIPSYSSRRGVSPRLFVLHYTVSPNRPGWSDVDAIVSLFSRLSFQASSNYVLDNEGHCAYIVRESDKAWTQAAFNSVAISVEVVNTGSEASYVGKGLKQLAVIVHDAAKRWKIPLQLGAVSGCTVTRAGIVDHGMLGACGGGHHDISPFAVAPVIAAAKAIEAPKIPKAKASAAACTVRNLRTHLGLPAAGWVGPKARAAIRVLQKRYGLKQTGYAGVMVGRILKLKGCSL